MEKTVKIVNNGGDVPNFSSAKVESVTLSNTTVLEKGYLYIGGDGSGTSDVNVKPANSPSTVIFKNVQDGSILPVYVIQVLSTDTTATNILILR